MLLRKIASAVAVLALAFGTPLTTSIQPAVQPGGDIPTDFRPPARPPAAAPAGPRLNAPPPGVFQYTRRQAMIPMRDGAQLHTVLILPKGAAKAPIVLNRTPYSATRETALGFGPWPENILSPLYAELVRAGYIVAVQDVRGKHGSQGEYVMNRPLRGPLNPSPVDHSTDAWDTIDWLVKRVPESNGRVATTGISYEGFTALMSLVDPHPALRAAVPINPMVDVWKGDDWFHNGAFRQEMISYVYGQTVARNSSQSWFRGGLDDYNAFLKAGSADAYARTLGIHQLPFWRRLTQHPAYDAYWQEQAVDRILARRSLPVPTLIVGGLWDQEDIYGAPALFEAVKPSSQNKVHLVLGPWHHGQMAGSALSLGPMQFGQDTGRWFRSQILLPFLDQHLKDAKPAAIARVTAFEAAANEWRRFDDWPPACLSGCPRSLTALHLAAQKRLSFAPARVGGSDRYVSDPARPVPYRAQANLSPWAPGSTWRFWLVDDQRFAGQRPDVLSYASEPLDKPLKLAGQPLAHLVASTSGQDSDWVVKLIDVYPENKQRPALSGYQLPIAMDVIRGRYRNDPSRPEPVPPNQPVTYRFALPHVSYTVQPGHRLMVQVQSSWFPLYDRNPQTWVPNIFFAPKSSYKAATQRVFHGPGGTWIGLPVVR